MPSNFQATVFPKSETEFVIYYKTDSPAYSIKERRTIRTLDEYKSLLEYLVDVTPYYLLSLPIERLFQKISTQKWSSTSDLQSVLDAIKPQGQSQMAASTEYEYNYARVFESPGMVKFLEADFQFTMPKQPRIVPKFQFFQKTKEVDEYYTKIIEELDHLIPIYIKIQKSNEKLHVYQQELHKATTGLGIPNEFVELKSRLTLFTVLESVLEDIYWIKRGMECRQCAMIAYDEACKETMKKVHQMEKLRSMANINQESVDRVLSELGPIKEVEAARKAEFYHISFVLKKEIGEWMSNRDYLLGECFNRLVLEQIQSIKR